MTKNSLSSTTQPLTPTEQKELAQAEEARAKTLATQIDMTCKLVPAVLIGYGIVLSFLYFSRALNFFPSGLNVGDTLLLVFITLGYTLFFWAIAGSGMILLIPASIFKERVDVRTKGLAAAKTPLEIIFYVVLGLTLPIVSGKYVLEDTANEFNFYLRLIAVVTIAILLIGIARYRGNKRGHEIQKKHRSAQVSTEGSQQPPVSAKQQETIWAATADVTLKSITYVLGLLFAIIAVHYGRDAGVLLVISACASGVVLALAADSLDQKPNQNAGKVFRYRLVLPLFLVAIASSIPLYWDGTQGQYRLTKSVFNWIGLNSADATVILTGGALRALEDQNAESELRLDICNNGVGSATVSGIDILWHGMGTRSLIRLGEKGKPEIEVNSKEVALVRNIGRRCHELSSTVHFPSGKTDPTSKEQLENLRAEFKQVVSSKSAPWRLTQINFVGYADPLPREQGNQKLSLARAQRLRDDLEQDIPGNDISIKKKLVANGARTTDYAKCAAIADPKRLSECYEVNRRASVKLYFEVPKAETDTQEK
ncbi:OmpA family protein [Herbaspirillum camelliae]|uniref:hypothetical protein n=1 Tax=Herbaspirillum camelliae TaxID=1892903 RepID=UPI000949E45D|nr:hypothetical protein [Herbaspirillum camelliae]